MKIRFDWEDVMEVEPSIEGDNYYCISFVFKDGNVCTYGYSNSKDFIKDYTDLMTDKRG